MKGCRAGRVGWKVVATGNRSILRKGGSRFLGIDAEDRKGRQTEGEGGRQMEREEDRRIRRKTD